MTMEKAERPKELQETTIRMLTGCGNMYVTLARHNGKLFEVFGVLGKSGGCPRCYAEATTRCITLGLRYGIPASEFVKQLENIACPSPTIEDGIKILSCPDAIAKAIGMDLPSPPDNEATVISSDN